jgi:glycosyltransferase involved in cell wall biosynthesis
MRLLHVTSTVDSRAGGPIEGILRQAEIHSQNGAEVEVLTLDRPDAEYIEQFPLKVHPMGSRSSWYPKIRKRVSWLRYGYTPRLVPWLINHAANYDAVVINGLWNYSSFGAWRALKTLNVPYFVFTHGMLDPWFRKTYPLKHVAKQALWLVGEGQLLAGARSVFFTSEEERVRASGQFFGFKYRERVIPYGTADVSGDAIAQISAYHETCGSPKERPFLLFLSRIHRKKGCDLLIEAFAKLAPDYPDIDLVMAGPDQTGWVAELKAMARSLNIADRVYWPGMLTGDAKWGALRSAEALVLPSHQENFGIVVAEALACRTPVLITDKVNIWREVKKSGAGLVGSDDVEGVTGLMEQFLSLDSEATYNMGVNARSAFEKYFNVVSTAREIQAIVIEARAAT